jgi:C4-dicarboxylate transporter DctQ subunit
MADNVRRMLRQVADLWSIVERYVTGVLVILMVGLYALDVLVRLFLPIYASRVAWIDEATRYMMIWVVFLAAGMTLEIGRHISVDLFLSRIPPRLLRVLYSVVDIVGLAFSVGACVYAIQLSIFVARTGQISPTLGISAAVLYVAPCVGFASLAFRFLLRLTNIRDARRTPVRPEWAGRAEL